jgi:hypothetical protein
MLLKSSLIRRSCFQVGINESSESWCRTEQSTFQSQKPKNHYMSVQTRRYLVALLLLTLVLLTESRRKFKRKKDNEKFRKNPSKISCCYVIYLFLIITFSIVFPLCHICCIEASMHPLWINIPSHEVKHFRLNALNTIATLSLIYVRRRVCAFNVL